MAFERGSLERSLERIIEAEIADSFRPEPPNVRMVTSQPSKQLYGVQFQPCLRPVLPVSLSAGTSGKSDETPGRFCLIKAS
jgi:hypothetical protein